MAITREQKEAQVKQLVLEFNRSKMTVLADCQGLSVADVQELRGLLKEQSSGMKVAKNNLVKLAASKSEGLKNIDANIFTGPMALIFGYEDEVAPAQVVANFAKKHSALEILRGIDAEGNLLEADSVKQLASLPSKQQLQGQVVGTMAAPISGFVRVLGANISGLVQVINQYSLSKSKA